MSICGALIPLFFGLGTMNIYTQVGLVTLIGLISKHGILMVEFANQLQVSEGLDRRRAIERAARVRLRPILMTTAAMVVGAGAAADRRPAPAPPAASRSASWSSPACRSARCSRCSCCRRSTPCWPRTTAPRPSSKRNAEIAALGREPGGAERPTRRMRRAPSRSRRPIDGRPHAARHARHRARIEGALLAARWLLFPLYAALLVAMLAIYVMVAREMVLLFSGRSTPRSRTSCSSCWRCSISCWSPTWW